MSDEVRAEEVEKFLAVQRTARAVADSAAGWWRKLTQAAESVVSVQSLDLLYRDILIDIKEVLGADEVSLLLANEAEDELVARASIGLGEEETVDLRIPAGQGMAGQVLVTQQPLIVNDLSQITLVNPVLRERGLRSVVAVPIVSDQRLFGVVHAGSYDLDHFTTSDAELLGILADRLAVALHRVRLFEQQRQLADFTTLLAETAKVMAQATDLTETLDRLARIALPALGDICLIDIFDEGSLNRVVARHRDPRSQDLVDRLRTDYPPDPAGNHPAVEVLHDGVTRWSPTMSDEFLRSTTRDDEHYALVKSLGFRSYLAVSIASDDAALGTLTLVSCSRSFSAGDVELAEALAQQVGSVVGKAQQLDLATQTSHVLQEALLPSKLPDIPGLVVHTHYQAATQTLEVGGDFYDVVALPDGQAWFIIGDVTGHDRGAAALMGQLRACARILAGQGNRPVGLIAVLQSCWDFLGFDRLATALIGQIDPSTGELILASAGHLPPLLVDETEADFIPIVPTVPLGAGGQPAIAVTMTLHLGQTLVLYTDGVLGERAWGVDEGMEQVRKAALCGGDPHAICQRIIEIHSGRDDDIALIAISRTRG
jgi:serine/threonine-protein kinase RsbW